MTGVSTFGSPIGDLELWRCADLLCEQHSDGIDALAQANERMLDLAGVGDEAGAATWAAIALRVIALTVR